MYRRKENYDQMAKLAISVLVDYGIKEFPISAIELCQKLGIKLVSYSELSIEGKNLALKKSKDGFSIKDAACRFTPMIIYNDDSSISKNRIRITVAHEIKHIINGDSAEDELEEDLANYFARYILCPIPYLIFENISSPLEIAHAFRVSSEVARYVSKNVKKRREKYGDTIFDYERPLIDMFKTKK